MNETNELGAISPLDGRYRGKVEGLAAYFSEESLFRTRIEVEARYLKALSSAGVVRKLTAKETGILDDIYASFSTKDASRIKAIEKTTRHDVKATEYWMKEHLQKTSLKDIVEFVHFGLTSTDTDNLAYSLLVQRAVQEVMLKNLKELITKICSIAREERSTVMVGKTHGQPAVPTTLGKEFAIIAMRLLEQYEQLKEYRSKGKLNGAVGNYNAVAFAVPRIDWIEFTESFAKELGIEANLFTTQIEPHDRLAELLDILRRINAIIINMDRDVWSYISQDVLILRAVKGEVGSSTMPQKVNPIDFENSEGNAKVAISLLEGLGRELQVSRMQRDLSDTTIMRNLGVMFGHSLIAYTSAMNGLGKIASNRTKISAELEKHYEILSEGYQTLLRLKGVKNPYELLKDAVRGKRMDKKELHAFAKSLKIDEATKKRLLELTPQGYCGKAIELTGRALAECEKRL